MPRRTITALILCAACCGQAIRLPAAEFAKPPLVVDLVVDHCGTLSGIVLTKQGNPCPAAQIECIGPDQLTTALTADAAGQFSTDRLHPGVYLIRVADSTWTCRIWAAGTAPPIASDSLVLIPHASVIRGQASVSGAFWRFYLPIGLVAGGVVGYRVSQKTAS